MKGSRVNKRCWSLCFSEFVWQSLKWPRNGWVCSWSFFEVSEWSIHLLTQVNISVQYLLWVWVGPTYVLYDIMIQGSNKLSDICKFGGSMNSLESWPSSGYVCIDFLRYMIIGGLATLTGHKMWMRVWKYVCMVLWNGLAWHLGCISNVPPNVPRIFGQWIGIICFLRVCWFPRPVQKKHAL